MKLKTTLSLKAFNALEGFAFKCAFEQGVYHLTLVMSRAMDLVAFNTAMSRQTKQLKVLAHEALGIASETVELARHLESEARSDRDWKSANIAINTFINLGLYEEALQIGQHWSRPEEDGQLSQWALVQINLAEALYDLGQWTEAYSRLQDLQHIERHLNPMTKNVLHIQLAWILAHTGRGEGALEALGKVRREHVAPSHWSEIDFTYAATFLALGRYNAADQTALSGMDHALRASSTRNGWFLRGQIAQADGRLEKANCFFRTGATHSYKGQGGSALLAWGDCLQSLENDVQAQEAWQLVLVRDPESSAAKEAALRLGSYRAGQSWLGRA